MTWTVNEHWRIYEKVKSDGSDCCDGRWACERRGPVHSARCNSRFAFGPQHDDASTHNAATDVESASSDVTRAGVRVGAGQLGVGRKCLGVGSRSMGASAESQGEVVTGTLETPRTGFPVGWRALAIRIRAA